MMWNKLKSAMLVPALLMSCMLFSGTALADAIAIVKADHPADTISKKNLKKILLGKTKKWDDGSPVVLVFRFVTDEQLMKGDEDSVPGGTGRFQWSICLVTRM